MTGKRAIIWCAVSSEEQAKNDKTSLETQERDARKFAEENDLEIVDLLIVGGFSRRFYNYPDFVQAAALDSFHDPARMIDHWKRKDFDILIARAGDRCGREQGILGEFVARTIHIGAKLYMLNEGWVDESNYRMYISMSGFSAATQVDNLKKGAKETKIRSAEKGLSTGSRHAYSHKWVRNDAGKLVSLELDESKRRLWDDLASVFLEGVSYKHIERELFERFGHVDERTGKPFTRYFFYHLLHNPYFWGNSGRSYKSVQTKNGQKVGAWVYNPSCPAPEGVHIFYNTNDAVYTGELAGRVQDELRRRAMAIQGTARPYRTHKFTGLILCGYCNHYMAFSGKGMYRCQSYEMARSEPRCDRSRHISERKVQKWVHAKLVEMLDHDMPDLLARSDDRPDLSGRINQLQREAADLEAQARALVVKQGQAHSALVSIYDDQLETLGERIERVQRALSDAEQEQRARDTNAARAAYHELPPNIEDLWTWESTAINQLLHRLMGNRRLVVKDGMILSTADAPPHPNRKERKRTYFGKGRNTPK